MTFHELTRMVDESDGEELRDCGVPLKMDVVDGVARIWCPVCGLRFECRGGQWEIAYQGSRGIRTGRSA